MNIKITSFFIFISTFLSAQTITLSGSVFGNEEAIPFANIALLNTSFGAETDGNGQFEIRAIPAGTYTLAISFLGFQNFQKKIELTENEEFKLDRIELKEDIFGLNEVVVTGTMKETFITDSPIKVEVVTGKYLEKNTSPTNLVEGITLVNGIEEVVECGVCFTNSIRINGLSGPYTAVLIDGTPMFGNLASVYGLNGIPTSIIDRFEVIKGPSSTLYGSEAVAGVINVITKKPEKQSLVSLDLMGTTHKEVFGNLTLAPKLGKWSGYVGLDAAYINEFHDDNGDGFGDFVNLDRYSVFTKWSLKRKNDKKFNLFAKYYFEDRRNGVEDYVLDRAYRELRGSDAIYGESIYTNRLEFFGTYELPTVENFKLDFSLSKHQQDSYYGADFYEAEQSIGYANLLWDKTLGRNTLIAGATSRFQNYDDNTVATEEKDRQFIPGVFVQNEWSPSRKFTLLTGSRLDHYSSHGFIVAPRLNAKYKTSDWTTLRFNFGTGFRIVNLFTEDHAFITGQRAVEILEDLDPERSWNTTLNFNHIYNIGNSQGSFDLDLFYTYFTNKIVPNYDSPNKIIYENTDGHAVSKGIGMNVTHSFMFPLSINAGFTFQKVTQTEPNMEGEMTTSNIEYAPKYSAIATVNYLWKKPQINFAYTFRLTGSMTLPEVFDFDENGNLKNEPRPTESQAFAFHNFQISKTFKNQPYSLYFGIQNLFDFRQESSPLVGFDDPNAAPGFSDSFDTAYAYSPIHGREIYLGVKLNLKQF